MAIQTHVFGILLPRLICHKESAKNYLLPIILLPFLFCRWPAVRFERLNYFALKIRLTGSVRNSLPFDIRDRTQCGKGRRGRGKPILAHTFE